ncbi:MULTISPECIES: phosphoribosylformylglycinamidine synthase subunit PurS [Helicobacter]|uniref:Phosphoribosylformylglycinamidine synthase subunit PurS n=1 Tax=Helicobacter ibis TaxID=2962633 RepID=A0ABT4VE56_9HELI|nr:MULTISPECIES: phosphoribosylformylglycinamidine synthase subunit PurS [Helicobacter]MDA3966395.1 phosphoribosylformylglycinamidine synthase subunit PurS [Helicobacter sp. WB40]MDA3968990.1 phosphoribosylformylglycinamidine synthase subunit PurS [Helicobacter ibis]
MIVEVKVRLRSGILDPQGKAIHHALLSLGHNSVSDVSVGKIITLNINSDDKEKVRQEVTEMCESLLANVVIEDYEILL